MTSAQVNHAFDIAKVVKPEPPRPLMREISPPEEFPVEVLPDVLKSAIMAIHERTQAALAMCAQSVLAASTLAVQSHADIELPTKQVKPISSYFLTIAASGERKSSCDYEALVPIKKRETALEAEYGSAKERWENDLAVWENEKKQILSQKNKKGSAVAKRADLEALGPKPVEPLVPIITCPEPTFEGLSRLFVSGQPSLGIFSSEGGQFVGGHGMSEDNKMKTAAGMSSLWDGEPIKRVRSGDGAFSLPGRRAALHLMAQPDIAGKFLSDRVLLDQGLLSRFLVVAPIPTSGSRLFRHPTEEGNNALVAYEKVLLHALNKAPKTVDDKPNQLDPRVLKLTADATVMWEKFVNFVEGELAPGKSFEPIRGFANKLAEHATRLAAVLTLFRDIDAEQISKEDMAAGIQLVHHYASEAQRLFMSSFTSPEIQAATKLLEWSRRQPSKTITLVDAYQYGPSGIRTASEAKKIAKVLVNHGHWEIIPEGAVVGGTHRKEAFRVITAEGDAQ